MISTSWSHPAVNVAISGMGSVEMVEQNCAAADRGPLSLEEAATLNVAGPVSSDRIEKLELAVESLQNEIEDLKKAFRSFKEQGI